MTRSGPAALRGFIAREQADVRAKRVAVYEKLWADPLYVRRHNRKDAYNRALSMAECYGPADPVELARLTARFKAANRRVLRMEQAALEAAGFKF